ncbi:MAG: hypothetical protein HZA82_04730 [Thaumarchaeota archaeon]|nr:hypothetical protein [Nitrososphaerota archaeon]
MERAPLNYKTKSKLLLVSFLFIGLSSLPFAFPHILVGHGIYYVIHVASISLGAFLSLIGFFTYREFRTTRLFLIMCAFLAVTVAESFSLINMLFPLLVSPIGLESVISHGLILLMLSFFVTGIFRSN